MYVIICTPTDNYVSDGVELVGPFDTEESAKTYTEVEYGVKWDTIGDFWNYEIKEIKTLDKP